MENIAESERLSGY